MKVRDFGVERGGRETPTPGPGERERERVAGGPTHRPLYGGGGGCTGPVSEKSRFQPQAPAEGGGGGG